MEGRAASWAPEIVQYQLRELQMATNGFSHEFEVPELPQIL